MAAKGAIKHSNAALIRSQSMTDKERGDIATQFKVGNKFWIARSSHGRKPIYDDPQKLQDAIEQYYNHVHENPLVEYKPMIEQGQISNAMIPKMCAMTITACARYCGMTYETWLQYRDNPDFSFIIKEAESIIYDQKLTGAAAGLLNANIIARELGLREASSVALETPQGLVFNLNYKGE